MKSHRGVFYFKTRDLAIAYAHDLGCFGVRLIHYELGWAVQKYISGPYLGPKGWA